MTRFTYSDTVVNKDNFKNIVCNKMQEVLNKSPVKEKFNISESLVKAENMEADVNRE